MAAVTMGGERLRGRCGGSAGAPQSVARLRHRRPARGLRCCALFPLLSLLPQPAPLPQVRGYFLLCSPVGGGHAAKM